MTPASILAPATGNDLDRIGFAVAMRMAKRYDAHVDAVFLRPDARDMVPMVGEAMSAVWVEQFTAALEEDAGKRLEVARRCFDAARDACGIAEAAEPGSPRAATAIWSELTGNHEAVARRAHLADLVVFSPRARNPEAQSYIAMEAVLIGGGRPLLLPPKTEPEAVLETVALAWNGSLEATRAVAAAMPYLAQAKAIHVLTAATRRTEVSAGAELVRYLGWHGLAATLHEIRPDGSVGKALLDTAKDAGADTVVLGGFSHSRLREMVLGGVTRHLVETPDLSVFLAH